MADLSWIFHIFVIPLQRKIIKNSDMLGMKQNGMSIKGTFARKIRMQLWRLATGNRNEEDQIMGSLHEDVLNGNQYKITWSI